jgi:hypothetical protein
MKKKSFRAYTLAIICSDSSLENGYPAPGTIIDNWLKELPVNSYQVLNTSQFNPSDFHINNMGLITKKKSAFLILFNNKKDYLRFKKEMDIPFIRMDD